MTGTASCLTVLDRSELLALFNERVTFDAPLAPYTSWKIGGPADALVHIENTQELGQLLRFCLRRRLAWFIVGNGSNLLIGDGGLRGVVIRLGKEFTQIQLEQTADQIVIHAGGAASLAQLVGQGATHGAIGIDGLAGIPGSVGGAIRMNAGTNRETGEFIDELIGMSPSNPAPHAIHASYSYRHSTLARDIVVTSARFVFERGDANTVRSLLQDRLIRRKNTQPLTWPNAGSCFRNPPNERAGQLIEAAGLKGYRIGDAQVSELHANFIVNLGKASAQDTAMLFAHVRRTVLAQTGIELQPEVHFVGVFTADTPQETVRA